MHLKMLFYGNLSLLSLDPRPLSSHVPCWSLTPGLKVRCGSS